MGNCLAGDSCIFSHDPALLLNRMNISEAKVDPSPSQIRPSLQVQDCNAFPALQSGATGRFEVPPGQVNSYNQSVSPRSMGYMPASRRQFEPRASPMSGLSSLYGSPDSRPVSPHLSSISISAPPIPAVDDTDAFPSLGAVSIKGTKKHHGKRGGHGHGHSNKENTPSLLADVVRMSPSPAPELHRKGLSKTCSYSGSRENSLAASRIPAPQYVPWLETGAKANHEYLGARQEAFKHGGLRNKFLQRFGEDTRADSSFYTDRCVVPLKLGTVTTPELQKR